MCNTHVTKQVNKERQRWARTNCRLQSVRVEQRRHRCGNAHYWLSLSED